MSKAKEVYFIEKHRGVTWETWGGPYTEPEAFNRFDEIGQFETNKGKYRLVKVVSHVIESKAV